MKDKVDQYKLKDIKFMKFSLKILNLKFFLSVKLNQNDNYYKLHDNLFYY